jgi:hypothetical protein
MFLTQKISYLYVDIAQIKTILFYKKQKFKNMTAQEIIDLGTRLGLPFDKQTNFKDMLKKDFVVFDGCNGQRFSFDGKTLTDDEIYSEMGKALILYGKRLKCMEIKEVLSVNSD